MTEDAEAARLHRELLLLAGRAPDDVLARARLTLAEGGLRTVAAVVAEQSAGRARSPYAFVAELPAPGRTPALVLDLTTGPDVRDPVDRGAARALVRVPEAVALWRAWRVLPGLDPAVVPPTRVYVLEASTIASLPAVTAVVMRALIRAGVPDPQVEAYPSGVEPPAYQRGARSASALLWTTGEAPPVRIAEPLTRDPIAEDERDKVSYLESGAIVMTTTRRGTDPVEPGRGAVVPMGHRTDGRWVWTEATAYYLRVHGLAPDAGLLADIRSAGYAPAPAGPVGTHRALAALLGQGE
ncbi:hypothetical protein COUCH_37160 [Couchioplanes caeruleus]|uniref:hypothetical protein n=1 Tax=Couchioplanes caeruleus TaxID=56438 RepID=UPI0020BFFA62|nr:hypothetical protein [Couchioplanes caeruleus]UQU64520.1 hypothetical protein COUCH_37160 [Couchioplanes caeruleus]